MTREQRADDIAIICEKCGCSDKAKARHYKMFVEEHFQPHASLRFKSWWFKQPEFQDSKLKDAAGIHPVVAQNVKRIWEAYLEAKQIGVA